VTRVLLRENDLLHKSQSYLRVVARDTGGQPSSVDVVSAGSTTTPTLAVESSSSTTFEPRLGDWATSRYGRNSFDVLGGEWSTSSFSCRACSCCWCWWFLTAKNHTVHTIWCDMERQQIASLIYRTEPWQKNTRWLYCVEWTQYSIRLEAVSFPAICNHCGVMTAWSRKTWKFWEQFLFCSVHTIWYDMER